MILTSDKLLHYNVAMAIVRVTFVIGLWLLLCQVNHWWVPFWIPAWFVGVILAAAAKEIIYDYVLNLGTAEWDDFLASCLGAINGFNLLKWEFKKAE